MKIIVLEGLDGSGKTTVGQLIVYKLNESGLKAKYLRSLDEWTTLGKATRRLLSENIDIDLVVQLMLANYNVTAKAVNILDDVDVVVIDRWILSTLSYGRVGLNLNNRTDKEYVDMANLIDATVRVVPLTVDATIFLDVDINVAERRITHREENDVYTGKLQIIKSAYDVSMDEFKSGILRADTKNSIGSIHSVDANLSIETVVDDCITIINSLYMHRGE